MFERILIALDGSELAEQVLPPAEALAEKFGSSVTLLRAVTSTDQIIMSTTTAPLMGQTFPMYPTIDPAELARAERQEAADYLQKIAEDLSKRKIEVSQTEPDGPAAGAIIEHARTSRADLIAMTTNGRSGLGRFVLGSVADEVIRKASCPVLLIRIGGAKDQET
jgi:nucleotide-binding universal stress UspA family protein